MQGANRIAKMLREARQQLGLSTEQAAADVGIPVQYVRLLEGEEGVPIGVADEMYLVPFFRRYAIHLGLDAARLMPEFLGQVQHTPTTQSAPIAFSYRSSSAGLWKSAAVLLAVLVAVFLFGRQSLERPSFEDTDLVNLHAQLDDHGMPMADDGPTQAQAPGSKTEQERVADALPLATSADTSPAFPVALATASAPAPEKTPAGHELRIVADEETWLSIGIDDQPKKSELMQAGDTQTLVANETFTLTVGNAGGITLEFDGRQLPRLGGSGQVVRNFRLPQAPPGDDAP